MQAPRTSPPWHRSDYIPPKVSEVVGPLAEHFFEGRVGPVESAFPQWGYFANPTRQLRDLYFERCAELALHLTPHQESKELGFVTEMLRDQDLLGQAITAISPDLKELEQEVRKKVAHAGQDIPTAARPTMVVLEKRVLAAMPFIPTLFFEIRNRHGELFSFAGDHLSYPQGGTVGHIAYRRRAREPIEIRHLYATGSITTEWEQMFSTMPPREGRYDLRPGLEWELRQEVAHMVSNEREGATVVPPPDLGFFPKETPPFGARFQFVCRYGDFMGQLRQSAGRRGYRFNLRRVHDLGNE